MMHGNGKSIAHITKETGVLCFKVGNGKSITYECYPAKGKTLILMNRELILQMVKTKTTVKQAPNLWGYTHLQRAQFPAATSVSRAQRHRSIVWGQPKRKQTGRAPMVPPIATEVEPEIQMGTEAAEQRNMEIQAQPNQVSPRQELVTNLNPVPDMPTAEQFLAEWVNIATGGTSTPEFITAVTPLTVTAGTM